MHSDASSDYARPNHQGSKRLLGLGVLTSSRLRAEPTSAAFQQEVIDSLLRLTASRTGDPSVKLIEPRSGGLKAAGKNRTLDFGHAP